MGSCPDVSPWRHKKKLNHQEQKGHQGILIGVKNHESDPFHLFKTENTESPVTLSPKKFFSVLCALGGDSLFSPSLCVEMNFELSGAEDEVSCKSLRIAMRESIADWGIWIAD